MNTSNKKAGYSLVEVSLALLVVGVGLLAVFALFPDALGSARKSVDAAEISEFAEYVFASIEGVIADSSFDWETLKTDFVLPKTDVLDPSQKAVKASGVRERYEWLPHTYGASVVERYVLAMFNYKLTITSVAGSHLKSVRLVVWPGATNTLSVSAGESFYREYTPLR